MPCTWHVGCGGRHSTHPRRAVAPVSLPPPRLCWEGGGGRDRRAATRTRVPASCGALVARRARGRSEGERVCARVRAASPSGLSARRGRRASSTRPPACTQRRSARGARRWRRARKRDVEVAPACVRCVRSPPPPARRPRRAIRTEQGPLPRPSACRYPRTSGSRSRPRSASCARAASQPRAPTRALVTDANTRRARRVGTSSRA